jgi:hypothetical protein
MKSAKEIAELTKDANTKSNQTSEIEKSIEKAAKKGEYFCWIYFPISDDIREILTELGYEVGSQQFDRNETLTKISWK